MIKPKALKRGDTVAIVSLSSGMGGEKPLIHRYYTGIKRLESVFGLHVITMPNALKGSEYLYNHPELRAQDLMQAFKDTNIRAIICMIGGDDTIRLLPYIDYQVIIKQEWSLSTGLVSWSNLQKTNKCIHIRLTILEKHYSLVIQK